MGSRWTGPAEMSGDGDRADLDALADVADIVRERQVVAPALCKSGWDGKACSKHRCGQYASYLKWPHGPPQTSPHAHPRLQRVSLYVLRNTHTRSRPDQVADAYNPLHMRKR